MFSHVSKMQLYIIKNDENLAVDWGGGYAYYVENDDVFSNIKSPRF